MNDVSLFLIRGITFGECREYFRSLSGEDRKNALDFIRENNYEALFLPQLAEMLSQEERMEFQKATQHLSVQSMMHKHGLNEVCKLFETQKIRHCRIKGTDLAYRIYPHPAMRPFGDWDILFHPEDCSRAVDLLLQNGWTTAIEGLEQNAKHHLTPVQKDNFMLEPHFTLANFGNVDPAELWTEIHPDAPGTCHYNLSPELNLLMLTRHAASEYYQHVSLWKLLLDCSFLMKKEKINWQKVHQLADRWSLPYPDDILCTWPDFFPADVLREMTPDQEKIKTFREIFSNRSELSATKWDIVMQDHIFSWNWIKKRVIAFQPARLRYKYPDNQGSYLSLFFYDLREKLRFFRKNVFRRKKNVKEYLDKIEKFESGGKR